MESKHKSKNQSIDRHNLAATLDNFPKQIEEASLLGKGISFSGMKNIVVCGVGGSALPGEFTRSAVESTVPVFIVKDYTLSKYVTKDSLIFAVSYSGNTEETLSAYGEARKRGAQIVVIASGGELIKKAKEDKTAYVQVPTGIPPRMSIGYQTAPILNILAQSGITPAIDWKQMVNSMEKEAVGIKKEAQKLAQRVKNKIPLIYASARFHAVAYKWKKDFNENTKIHAFSNYFPEFNHNEINGYVNLNGNYIVFIIKDQEDHPRIKKRMEVIAELIKEKGVEVITIETKGPDILTRMFLTVWLGDWISYDCAIELGTDPTPVDIIEDLKRKMRE